MKNETRETQYFLLMESDRGQQDRQGSKMAHKTPFRAPRGVRPQTPRHPQSPEQALPQLPLLSLDCLDIYHQRAAAWSTSVKGEHSLSAFLYSLL